MTEDIKVFNSIVSRQAQKKLCEEHQYPHFAPLNGRCYSCNADIYTEQQRGSYSTGIDVIKAGTSLVTGCPHCNKSYCD